MRVQKRCCKATKREKVLKACGKKKKNGNSGNSERRDKDIERAGIPRGEK